MTSVGSATGATAATNATFVVDDGAEPGVDYRSIQAAVDNATDGDTIEVRTGTYQEAVTVDKNVTLTAPQGATLEGSNLADGTHGITIGTGGRSPRRSRGSLSSATTTASRRGTPGAPGRSGTWLSG